MLYSCTCRPLHAPTVPPGMAAALANGHEERRPTGRAHVCDSLDRKPRWRASAMELRLVRRGSRAPAAATARAATWADPGDRSAARTASRRGAAKRRTSAELVRDGAPA